MLDLSYATQMVALFGTVDPYAVVLHEGTEHRTKTIKNSFMPEWNKSFIFNVADVTKGAKSDLVVKIVDWGDATGKREEIGACTIPASRMSEVVRAKVGWEGQDTLSLYNRGKAVKGHDKQPSQVTVRVRVQELPNVQEMPKAFDTLEVDDEAQGPRQMIVTVVSANHLPKVRMVYVAW